MKNSNQWILQRRNNLLTQISDHKLSIKELSNRLNTSEMTIRRDCKILEKMGIVTVKLGSVMLTNNQSSFTNMPINHIDDLLAKKAADFINDNDVLFINSSTTAIKTIKYINKKNITLITNNLYALSYDFNSDINLVLSGGKVNKSLMSTVDDMSFKTFKGIHANTAIIGCDGITINEGIFTSKIDSAHINRIIIRNSKKVICTANYKKIGAIANFKVANLKDIDILITDSFADNHILQKLENNGITVIQINI